MRRTHLSVLTVLALLLMAPPAAQATASTPSGKARTERYLDTIRTRPAKLRAFLNAMPKGADLHNHLSGAVPTETLIGYAVRDGLCIDATHDGVDGARSDAVGPQAGIHRWSPLDRAERHPRYARGARATRRGLTTASCGDQAPVQALASHRRGRST